MQVVVVAAPHGRSHGPAREDLAAGARARLAAAALRDVREKELRVAAAALPLRSYVRLSTRGETLVVSAAALPVVEARPLPEIASLLSQLLNVGSPGAKGSPED